MKKILNLCDAPKGKNLIICSLDNSSSRQDSNISLLLHGLIPGQNIRVISNHSGQPMLIEVRNAYLALDPIHAIKINVELEENF